MALIGLNILNHEDREDRKENNLGSFGCRAISKVPRIKDGIQRMIWRER
jgi:hypothetical protein